MTRREPGIMIVDRDAGSGERIQSILANAGLASQVATNPSSVLEAIPSTIGILLLDLALLPDQDAEVIRRGVDRRPGLRIIALADEDSADQVLEALRAGACDYLAKPLHSEELTLSVRRALEHHALSTEGARARQRLALLGTRVESLGARALGQRGENRLALVREGVVASASEILDADKVSLILLDRDADVLRVVAWSGRALKPDEAEPIEVGHGVAGVIFEKREAWVVADAAADARVTTVDRMGRYRSPSFVAAPVLCSGRAMGVLCATDRRRGSVFSEEDLAFLRVLAAQVGPLLESVLGTEPIETLSDSESLMSEKDSSEWVSPATTEDSVSDQAAEMAREICQAAVDEVETERVIQGILQPLVRGLSAAPVSLFLVAGDDESLRREGECDGGVVGDREHLSRSAGLTGHVLRTGQLVATARPQADPRFDLETDTPEDGHIRPMLCLPLTLRGRIVGVCRAFLSEEDADPPVRTAEVIAPALSAALRNALLYRSLLEAIEDVATARRAARS